MENIRIERFRNGQEKMVHDLIKTVYDEFVAPGYSVKGNNFFYDFIAYNRIASRQHTKNNVWLAFSDDRLAGMIEIRDNCYISLLFVYKEYQGTGIAKKLFESALSVCKRRDPSLSMFFVHASPFSLPIYKKLGFKETGPMITENGIDYYPMEMKIL